MSALRAFCRAAIFCAAAAASLLPAGETYAQKTAAKEAVLLVAHPGMVDPRFASSVVLVTFPLDAGPMGVILNQPSTVELRSIWPQRPERQGRTDLIYFGGPVEPDGLLFVFRMSPPPAKAVWAIGDIHLSGDGQLLEKLLEKTSPVPDQRFFAGYAGWAPGQLESEIDQGGWYVLPADENVIFTLSGEKLWEDLLKRATMLRAGKEP
jgi:putative transcriptional regulator